MKDDLSGYPYGAAGDPAMSVDILRSQPFGFWLRHISRHGWIQLIDVMPRLVYPNETCDHAICRAARMSTGGDIKLPEEDRKLIEYLMQHRHTSPFEMVETKWRVALPIFVARQWVRHRTANLNEYSGRYSVLPEAWFDPAKEGGWRGKDKKNKQGSAGEVKYERYEYAPDESGVYSEDAVLLLSEQVAFYEYRQRTAAGIANELARTCLPLSTLTYWEWKIDLHNLLHFLHLRDSDHAQKEIRVYAQAMLEMITPLVPWTIKAWREWVHEAKVISKSEWEVILGRWPIDNQ